LFFDLEHGRRSTVGDVQVDQRSLATALEAYYVDNSAYPAWSRGALGVKGFLTPGHPSYNVPTFRVWATKAEFNTFTTLTTPLAYLTDYFSDLFVPDVNGVSFSYYSDDNGWILISPGPDGIYDIDPPDIYDSSVSQPSFKLLTGTNSQGMAFTYDPTNGAISPGDVYRVKQ